MNGPTIHGKAPAFSASTVLAAVGDELGIIRQTDRLTWTDVGAVLGVSADQAAKYADGSAAMNVVAYARGKREWNGRFTGKLDRLCHDARPCEGDDRRRGSAVLRAALALSIALEDDDQIDADEVRANRATIENARDALEELLAKLTPKVA